MKSVTLEVRREGLWLRGKEEPEPSRRVRRSPLSRDRGMGRWGLFQAEETMEKRETTSELSLGNFSVWL